MAIEANQIIGELVAKDYRTAAVFKRHKIDFCCNGNTTIDDACQKRHLDSVPLLEELNQVTQKVDNTQTDYASWPLDLLADYIEKKHHRYVREKVEEIRPFLDKVCRVHGHANPELLEIQSLFYDSAAELTAHMRKEEMILFPYIRNLAQAESGEAPLPSAPFGSVQFPVAMMMDEHSQEGERFRNIAALSHDYTPPAHACNTYRVTYALIQEFEADLHHHIHLENNILFPRAIELEQQKR